MTLQTSETVTQPSNTLLPLEQKEEDFLCVPVMEEGDLDRVEVMEEEEDFSWVENRPRHRRHHRQI